MYTENSTCHPCHSIDIKQHFPLLNKPLRWAQRAGSDWSPKKWSQEDQKAASGRLELLASD